MVGTVQQGRRKQSNWSGHGWAVKLMSNIEPPDINPVSKGTIILGR